MQSESAGSRYAFGTFRNCGALSANTQEELSSETANVYSITAERAAHLKVRKVPAHVNNDFRAYGGFVIPLGISECSKKT